jgi:hypothetical protein
MFAFIVKAKQYVWDFVELAFAAVLGIMLIYLVLGKDSGVFVLSVAGNVIKFTNDVPSGNLVAFAIVGALLYWFAQKNGSLGRRPGGRIRKSGLAADRLSGETNATGHGGGTS